MGAAAWDTEALGGFERERARWASVGGLNDESSTEIRKLERWASNVSVSDESPGDIQGYKIINDFRQIGAHL